MGVEGELELGKSKMDFSLSLKTKTERRGGKETRSLQQTLRRRKTINYKKRRRKMRSGLKSVTGLEGCRDCSASKCHPLPASCECWHEENRPQKESWEDVRAGSREHTGEDGRRCLCA